MISFTGSGLGKTIATNATSLTFFLKRIYKVKKFLIVALPCIICSMMIVASSLHSGRNAVMAEAMQRAIDAQEAREIFDSLFSEYGDKLDRKIDSIGDRVGDLEASLSAKLKSSEFDQSAIDGVRASLSAVEGKYDLLGKASYNTSKQLEDRIAALEDSFDKRLKNIGIDEKLVAIRSTIDDRFEKAENTELVEKLAKLELAYDQIKKERDEEKKLRVQSGGSGSTGTKTTSVYQNSPVVSTVNSGGSTGSSVRNVYQSSSTPRVFNSSVRQNVFGGTVSRTRAVGGETTDCTNGYCEVQQSIPIENNSIETYDEFDIVNPVQSSQYPTCSGPNCPQVKSQPRLQSRPRLFKR